MFKAALVQVVSMATLAGEYGRWELRAKYYFSLLYTFRIFSLTCDLKIFGNKSESLLDTPSNHIVTAIALVPVIIVFCTPLQEPFIGLPASTLSPTSSAFILQMQPRDILKMQIWFSLPTLKHVMVSCCSLQKAPILCLPLGSAYTGFPEASPITDTYHLLPHCSRLPLTLSEPTPASGPADALFLLHGMFFSSSFGPPLAHLLGLGFNVTSFLRVASPLKTRLDLPVTAWHGPLFFSSIALITMI